VVEYNNVITPARSRDAGTREARPAPRSGHAECLGTDEPASESAGRNGSAHEPAASGHAVIALLDGTRSRFADTPLGAESVCYADVRGVRVVTTRRIALPHSTNGNAIAS
jgi:hypothetical protein